MLFQFTNCVTLTLCIYLIKNFTISIHNPYRITTFVMLNLKRIAYENFSFQIHFVCHLIIIGIL